jgi:hypothetical protein
METLAMCVLCTSSKYYAQVGQEGPRRRTTGDGRAELAPGELDPVHERDLSGGVHLSPEQAKQLPPEVHAQFLDAFSHSLHGVFLFGVLLAIVPFGLSWLLKEVPLRTTLHHPEEPVAEPVV